MIFIANKMTGFCMMTTLGFNELKMAVLKIKVYT